MKGKKVLGIHTVYTGVTFGLGIGVPKDSIAAVSRGGGVKGLSNVLPSAHSKQSIQIAQYTIIGHRDCSDSLVKSDLFALRFDNGTAELLHSSFVISGVLRLVFLRACGCALIMRAAVFGFSGF